MIYKYKNFKTQLILEMSGNDFSKIIQLSEMNIERGASKTEEDNAMKIAKSLIKKNGFKREDFIGKISDKIIIKLFGSQSSKRTEDSNMDIVEVTDDNGRKVSMRKIKLNYGDGKREDVLVYDVDSLYDVFIKSPYYTFMNWSGDKPTRTTSSRILNVYTSWFETIDKGGLSSWFYDSKTEETAGAFALCDNQYSFYTSEVEITKPSHPILLIVGNVSLNKYFYNKYF